ncbi:CBU_0592 family membrane protein [Phenylobacterium montanum]|uniref:CBU-0592-like domain-containing protein n=1 Tax=Phenylobacterium montanum TaxID=2823693 RepID=A0A975FYU0_9CAUL|nr:hypothetical protein [Caulobacter sp. S6]QUD86816.1 hypothetical protein KCG34_17285 [Caulobacter sp. S6]
MTVFDIAGVAGVGLILAAYVGTQFRGLDPTRAPSLVMNLMGALLILGSLAKAFNLSAALMEGAWALVAAFGLVKLALRRR